MSSKTLVAGKLIAHMILLEVRIFEDLVLGTPNAGPGLIARKDPTCKVLTAGELGQDAETVEAQLSFTFRITNHWKALVLLETDGQIEHQKSLSTEATNAHDRQRSITGARWFGFCTGLYLTALLYGEISLCIN